MQKLVLSSKENFFFMGGHLATDLCHGSLPAILAFMYQDGILDSYSAVALLIMANTMVNAVVQPVAGYLADAAPRPYLMAVGLLLSSLGIMFTGLVSNFWALFLLIALNGVGLAMFHPAGGKITNIFSKARMGRGLSIFSLGGNIGFAVGPIYFTGFYMLMGLKATLMLCLPALIMITVLLFKNRFYMTVSKLDNKKSLQKSACADNRENLKGFVLLLSVIFARSAAWMGLMSFLSLYFMHEMGVQEELAAMLNGVVAICGALATLIGGSFSDKFGFLRLVRCSSVLSIPFITWFCFTSSPILALAALLPFALLFYASMSPLMVIGQNFLNRHVGMATGFTIGLGMSFGGLTAPLLGKIGDSFGLDVSMKIILSLIVLAALLTFAIPKLKNGK